MIKFIENVIRSYKMKQMEKAADIKKINILEQIKKIYQLIKIVEKGYCKDRTAKKQFRRDIVDRGFIHATLMKRLLVNRDALDDVLKINPEKNAKKEYRLIKKLVRKKKISKLVAKELRNQSTNIKVK